MKEEEVLICRCQEVTEQEILDAVRAGAATVDGVKRRTRACMGLCQGKTCGKLVTRIIQEETGKKASEIPPATDRPPVRPVTFGALATAGKGEDDNG